MKQLHPCLIVCVCLAAWLLGCEDKETAKLNEERARLNESLKKLSDAQFASKDVQFGDNITMENVHEDLDLAAMRQEKHDALLAELQAQRNLGPRWKQVAVTRLLAELHVSKARYLSEMAIEHASSLIGLEALNAEEHVDPKQEHVRLIDMMATAADHDAAARRLTSTELGTDTLVTRINELSQVRQGLVEERKDLTAQIGRQQTALREAEQAKAEALAAAADYAGRAEGKKGLDAFVGKARAEVLEILDISSEQLDARIEKEGLKAEGEGADQQVFLDLMELSYAERRKARRAENDIQEAKVKLWKLESQRDVIDMRISRIDEMIRPGTDGDAGTLYAYRQAIEARNRAKRAEASEASTQRDQVLSAMHASLADIDAAYDKNVRSVYAEAEGHTVTAVELLDEALNKAQAGRNLTAVHFDRVAAIVEKLRVESEQMMMDGAMAQKLAYIGGLTKELDLESRSQQAAARYIDEFDGRIKRAAATHQEALNAIAELRKQSLPEESQEALQALVNEVDAIKKAIDDAGDRLASARASMNR